MSLRIVHTFFDSCKTVYHLTKKAMNELFIAFFVYLRQYSFEWSSWKKISTVHFLPYAKFDQTIFIRTDM
ncbi:hypothetical protein PEPS_24910 [Persicobacter psychrovividus]|uniref:Uncharacterized protein n=1 Tax=Persicobacter psychrovividus TaxID=387638 RepID=A0ABM7VGW7_9BACT|nr:hypothetical protein PEPS_24910 [Persicobacter psychrovividus]